MEHRNLAARAGRWSARHRRTAILGWLAFVIVAVALGGPMKNIADEDQGNGESRRADQSLAAAGFDENAGEQVFVQGRGGVRADDPRFAAAVRELQARLGALPAITAVQGPFERGNDGQVSGDRRSALVDFEITGTDEQAEERVDATLAAVAGVQRAHPELRVEQFGDASANKALSKVFADDFRKAEFLSLPITLLILVLAFGALVAAGLPLLLALSAVAATIGLLGRSARSRRWRSRSGRWSCSSAWPWAWTTACSTCAGSARNAPPDAPRRQPWRPPPRPPAAPC